MLGPFWVWLVVGEEPGLWATSGGLVVIAAVVANSLIPVRDGFGRRLKVLSRR